VEADPAAPAVILVHGLNGCKCGTSVLVPAGMLYRAGFNVLMFDMRDMGMSDIEDGRYSAGTKEYLDMLGAWDWLIAHKGIPPERIGLFGVSLGAATTLNAVAAEPRVAAAFVDSPFADLQTVMDEELMRNNYPTWLAPGGVMMARLLSGDDLLSRSPSDAIRRDAGRPLFITHGEGDQRINVHHSRDLAALAEQTGANVQTWFVPGVDHTEAMFEVTAEYERRLTEFFRVLEDSK
jgi:dipeptidyl aminopeptidase/acylaminoacyl peptidase